MNPIHRSKLAWGLYGFLMGALITVSIFLAAMRSAIIHERRSPHDFAITVQTVIANAVSRGWKVSRIEDFHEALAQTEGSRLAPLQVIELCHSDYARRMFRSGKSSCVAMMPCAIAVYEKEGQVYVASLNRGLIGRFFRRETAGVMRKVRADEREILRFLAEP